MCRHCSRAGLESATNGFASQGSRYGKPVISQCCNVFEPSPFPKTSRAFRPSPVHTGWIGDERILHGQSSGSTSAGRESPIPVLSAWHPLEPPTYMRRGPAVTGRQCSVEPTAQRLGVDDRTPADAIVCASSEWRHRRRTSLNPLG